MEIALAVANVRARAGVAMDLSPIQQENDFIDLWIKSPSNTYIGASFSWISNPDIVKTPNDSYGFTAKHTKRIRASDHDREREFVLMDWMYANKFDKVQVHDLAHIGMWHLSRTPEFELKSQEFFCIPERRYYDRLGYHNRIRVKLICLAKLMMPDLAMLVATYLFPISFKVKRQRVPKLF